MDHRDEKLSGSEQRHTINENDESRLLRGMSSDRESRKLRRRTVCLCMLCLSVVTVLVLAAVVTLSVVLTRNDAAAALPDDPRERALALLTDYPVIDG